MTEQPAHLTVTAGTDGAVTLNAGGTVSLTLAPDQVNDTAHRILDDVITAAGTGRTDVYMTIGDRDIILDGRTAITLAEQLLRIAGHAP